MTYLLLSLSLAAAVTAAFYFGYRYAKARERLKEKTALAIAQTKIIHAMKLAVEREAKLRETFTKVERASSPDELNRLYSEIISSLPNRDPEHLESS